MMQCLNTRTKTFDKGEIVMLSGDLVSQICLVISGGVRIIHEDVAGNSTILTELGPAELFGEAFAYAGLDHSPVTVQAGEKSEILFFDYKKLITTCAVACLFHARLIENMVKVLAQKNLQLQQKIEILSKRTTREKLLSYFDLQRGAAKKFTIGLNREEMARYLCIDRSAMSNELCKMRDEGLITFKKNTFELL
ncbi:MAG: Crp/Fnr family transcriptional regulator [Propionibacteriaceae bacterium]|nr:Crp/Fnr family transcriptional regulator [Propionibacteriaceae bacterium]